MAIKVSAIIYAVYKELRRRRRVDRDTKGNKFSILMGKQSTHDVDFQQDYSIASKANVGVGQNSVCVNVMQSPSDNINDGKKWDMRKVKGFLCKG